MVNMTGIKLRPDRLTGFLIGIIASILGIFLLYYIFAGRAVTFFIGSERIESAVSGIIRDNLGRAVSFDKLSVDSSMNIVAVNLSISNSSDFNDNIKFVYAEKAEFELSLLSLIRNRIRLKGVVFSNAEVNLVKPYGKNHVEALGRLFSLGRNIEIVKKQLEKGFYVRFEETRLLYTEFFRDSRREIKIHDINGDFEYRKSKIEYSVAGKTAPCETSEITDGYFSSRGSFQFRKDGVASSVEFSCQSVDVSYANEYFREKSGRGIKLTGGLNADISASGKQGKYKIDGGLRTGNWNIFSEDDPHHRMISNANINTEINLEIDSEKKVIVIHKLKAYDDVNSLSFSAKVGGFPDVAALAVKVESAKGIDLSEISQVFTPFPNITFSGGMEFSGGFECDLAEGKIIKSNFRADAKKVKAVEYTNGKKRELLRSSNFSLRSADDILMASAEIHSDKADLTILLESKINSLKPLKSVTSVEVKGDNISLPFIAGATAASYDRMFKLSHYYRDRGYDDTPFLKKTVSNYFIYNDISANVDLKRMNVAGGASLSGISAELRLEKGVFSLREFSASGFNGEYYLEASAYANSNYPSWSVRGGVKGMDIGEFSRQAATGYSLNGTMDLDFDFSLNAYRLAQFVENTTASINLNVRDGSFSATPVQLAFQQLAEDEEFPVGIFKNTACRHLSLSLKQMGDTVSVNGPSISGDVDVSGYGRYTYHSGLNSQINIAARDEAGKLWTLPVLVKGSFLKPVISRKNGKSDKEYALF